MAKLTDNDKRIAREVKEDFNRWPDSRIVYDTTSGITVAVTPNDNMMGFLRVYVVYCSNLDTFSKKRARLAIRKRMDNDNYIIVPFTYNMRKLVWRIVEL